MKPLDIDRMFAALAEAARADSEQRRADREARQEARRNDPVLRARRSAAAKRGAETRKANALAAAAERDVDDWPVRTGPTCDEMNHNGIGREVFCRLEPGHDEDHDDDCGTTWEREDDDAPEATDE